MIVLFVFKTEIVKCLVNRNVDALTSKVLVVY